MFFADLRLGRSFGSSLRVEEETARAINIPISLLEVILSDVFVGVGSSSETGDLVFLCFVETLFVRKEFKVGYPHCELKISLLIIFLIFFFKDIFMKFKGNKLESIKNSVAYEYHHLYKSFLNVISGNNYA